MQKNKKIFFSLHFSILIYFNNFSLVFGNIMTVARFSPFPDCGDDVHRRRGRDGGVDGGGGAVGVGGEHGLVEGVAVGGIVAVVPVGPR